MIIKLDGIRTRVEPPDLDGDGKTGGVEIVKQDIGITSIQQPTELGESLKELNDDNLDRNSRMSNIDMRSRLHYIEVNGVLAIDTLVALKVLPSSCLSFTRQKKRLNVSLDGQGRTEIVQVVAGKRELEAKQMSFGERVKGFFGGNNEG